MAFSVPSNSLLKKNIFLLLILFIGSCSYAQNSQELCVGSTVSIANPNPSGSWVSSDPSVATVDNQGNVTAISAGICDINVMDNSFNITSTSTIHVITANFPLFGQDSVCVDGIIHLTSSTTSGNWTSSNLAIASVDGNGAITGHIVGSTTITYTVCNYSVSKNISVYLANPPTLNLITAPSTLHQMLTPNYINVTSDTAFYVAMDTVRFQIGGGATGAYLCSGPNSLPKGVTWNFSNGIFQICGTPYLVAPFPTTSTPFHYSVCTTGGVNCIPDQLAGEVDTFYISYTGDITLAAPCFNTISGPTYSEFCSGQPYAVTFAVNGSPTDFVASNLPPGCTGSFTAGAYTIFGSPTFMEGTYPFVLYTFGGGCFQSEFGSTIHLSGFPNAGPITGSPQICVGNTTQLNVLNYGSMFGFSDWYSEDPSIASINQYGIVTGLKAGSTFIIYTYGSGSCVQTDFFFLTVNPLPDVSAGLDQTVCYGLNISLSGMGADTYTWNNGASNNQLFTPPIGSTTYQVTGTDVNGCVNYDQLVITVNPLPEVNAGEDITVCEGSAVTLSGAGALTYFWDNGIANNTLFIPSIGTNTYTVEGTDINGCINNDQVNVIVDSISTIATITGPINVCTDAAITLFDETAGGIWSSQDESIATIDQYGNVTGHTSGTVTIVYGLTDNCSVSQVYQIQIDQAPVIESIVGDTTLCSNSVTTLSCNSLGGAWSSLNDAVAIVDQNGVVTGISAGSDSIRYTISNENCSTSKTQQITVGVCTNLVLTSSILSGNQVVCVNTQINPIEYTMTGNAENVSITSGNLPNGILWNYSNGIFTISGVPTQMGTFSYTISTSGSPYGSEVSLSGTIVVEDLPVANFTYIISNLTVQFTNLSSGTPTDYTWNFGLSSTVELNPTYTFPSSGTYSVVLYAQNKCGIDSIVSTIGITGIDEVDADYIEIAPNPAVNSLHIEKRYSEYLDILIQDLTGKILFQQEFSNNQKDIDISNLAMGQYLLIAISQNGSIVKRFTKME